MDSFEELNLSPAVVEALAAEGIERPTALQSAAVPVIFRGNNLVARAAAGAGVTVAVGAPLIDRLEPGTGGPVALIVAPTPERVAEMATRLGRIAAVGGHQVAALDPRWALPERASVLVATPAAVGAALARSEVDLSGVEALVLEGAATLATMDDAWSTVETLFEIVPEGAQRVVVSLPVPPRVQELVDARVRRSVTVPPGDGQGDAPHRGTVNVRTVAAGELSDALAALAGELFDETVHHVMVFTSSEDAAADLADALTLHGFAAGAAGDAELPVWIGVDPLGARPILDEEEDGSVVVVSADVPGDPDDLDRRHGGGRQGWILARAGELPHLRDVAARTGYDVSVRPAPRARGDRSELDLVLDAVESAMQNADVDAYQVVLEPLFATHGAERVAGALLAALRSRPALIEAMAATRTPPPATAPGRSPAGAPAASKQPEDMVKLFISVGERDGARPGDLVGAITGEARIDGDLIGRIEMRDTFSRVEVAREVAQKVIRSLNGTTVRGRSVRVDLDRSERAGGRSPRAGGRGGPRKRGG